MRTLYKVLPLFVLGLSLLFPVFGAEPVSASFWTQTAIGGKDTVSYHDSAAQKAHRVVEGEKRYEVLYLGAHWRFASMSSAERFAANPAAYAPSYNGHCANALSTDEGLVETDGDVWEFFGDRLYLFYAEAGRQRWLQGDWKSYKIQADAAWQAITQKP
ncbi:YHS domain-containing (seleno)protein [Hydrogenophaga sp.]|uniref:YHS domain-containing (seleno)protein n=1 Tax=Hydrogenophaga sp. TaxID=1904254 RepID=UPI0035675411